MPTVKCRVKQSFYDRSYGMKFRRQGELFEETSKRAQELKAMGLVMIVKDDKSNKDEAAAEK